MKAIETAGKDGPVRLRVQTVPVMLKLDDTSRRKVDTARRLAASTNAAMPLVWASSPESTIERFAPGAAAVCVIVRADNSLAGIIVLDGRARERDALRADFVKALTPKPPASPGE